MTQVMTFDIETDGLYQDATKIHCVAIKTNDQPVELFTDIEEAANKLRTADLLVAHNGINFDLPVLAKLGYEVDVPIHDTLIMSRLAYPNLISSDANRKTIPPKLKGSHSLKAWGYRVRLLKGDFSSEDTDWSTYSPEMGEYCKQDVEVTYKTYHEKLLTQKIPEKAINLEQDFARIISRQEKHGVYFDVSAAKDLHVELLGEIDKAEEELHKVFKPLQTWTPKPYPKNPYKKDGTKAKALLSQEALGCHYNDKGDWGYYKKVVFNPSSRQHIARWLTEVYGWKPTEYTEKDSVIINEGVLSTLDFTEGKILAHYFNVKKLIGQLAEGANGWLKLVTADSRIHGSVNTLGAVSRRCTHSKPNLAQVPSGRAYKGKEARMLFSVPAGKKMVGVDLSGLELRVFAHYLANYDNGKYADLILNGDIHSYNQKAANLPTRDMAKTFIYGLLYGAGDAKIGEIIKGTPEQGRRLKQSFFKAVPAYKRLLERVDEKYKQSKTLLALDGNRYFIRSSHSALNTLLQGAGALIAKMWLVVTDEELQKKYKGRYEFVLNVHDEYQIECDEDIAEDVASICEQASIEAGKRLKIRMPINSEAEVGNNWYDTH